MRKILIIMVALLLIPFISGFTPQDDINLRNYYQIVNGTNISATALYQDGNPVLDNSTVINNANYSSYSNSSAYWDNLNTPADINAGDITDDGTYINSSSEPNLNVNYSNSTTWWSEISGWSSSVFESVTNSLNINMSWFNNSIDSRVDTLEPDLSVNHSAYSNHSNYADEVTNISIYDYGLLSYWDNITNRWTYLSNFTDDLGDRGYTSLDNFTNDPEFINDTFGNATYIIQSEEPNLTVNSSNSTTWWAGISDFSSTMFEEISNELSVKMSWFNSSTDDRVATLEPDLNVNNSNSSDYWDGETSQSDLNVNDSDYLDGYDSADFILASTEGDLNVNSSDYWDGETSQSDLNVNDSDYLDGYDSTDFIFASEEGNLNVNHSDTSSLSEDSSAWITMTDIESKWFSDVTNELTFDEEELNDSILDGLVTTYYNASSVVAVIGTVEGDLADIQAFNGDIYNISEVSSEFDLRVNFTGITDFNQIIYRYKSETEEPHTMYAQVWSYTDSAWQHISQESTREHLGIFVYPIFVSSDHISGGLVQLRFYVDGGTPPKTHKWQFDWITISLGVATPSSSESDPFSIHKDGNTPLTGNWDAGSYNISAEKFFQGK